MHVEARHVLALKARQLIVLRKQSEQEFGTIWMSIIVKQKIFFKFISSWHKTPTFKFEKNSFWEFYPENRLIFDSECES